MEKEVQGQRKEPEAEGSASAEGQAQRKAIKTVLCQVKPFYMDKETSIDRVSASLEKYSALDHLDVVCLPELAFTGYNFEDKQEALTLAARRNQGIEFEFARALALRLKAYVVFGYIQRSGLLEQTENLYSSAAVIDRQGILLQNYRKCHLYYNDKFWASPGSNFATFTLTNTSNQSLQCTLALGTDLNQKDFTSGEFQLANHLVKTKSDILLLPMNWMDSKNSELHRNDISGTYSYWLGRLAPVTASKRGLLVLAVNRVGLEYDYFAKKQVRFYGSSAAIMLSPHKILSNLQIENEGYMVVDTFLL